MRRFCENKKCEWNDVVDNHTGSMQKVAACSDTNPMKVIQSRNYEYRNKQGSTIFYLCETCHNAVEMVVRN